MKNIVEYYRNCSSQRKYAETQSSDFIPDSLNENPKCQDRPGSNIKKESRNYGTHPIQSLERWYTMKDYK